MVHAGSDGQKNVTSLKIDPEVVSKEDVEMLQDLVMAALNDAARFSTERHANVIRL